jgi:large subunit ribosomal protein L5
VNVCMNSSTVCLVTIAMPRIRDFRGLNRKNFDGRELHMGLKEQIIFRDLTIRSKGSLRGMEYHCHHNGEHR